VKCNKCGEEKPITEFYYNYRRKYGCDTICKECVKRQVQTYRKPFKKINNWLWTNAAIDCYKRGCVCSGCYFENFFTDEHQKCQMKFAVIELVKKFGRPKEAEDE
jgi:hypothetical protein